MRSCLCNHKGNTTLPLVKYSWYCTPVAVLYLVHQPLHDPQTGVVVTACVIMQDDYELALTLARIAAALYRLLLSEHQGITCMLQSLACR